MAIDPDIATAIRRSILGIVILLVGVLVLGIVYRDPLESIATDLVNNFGYLGIALGVLLADMFTFPLPADVYLFIGIAGGADPLWIIVAASSASIVGGMGAYKIGQWLGETRWIRRWISQVREKNRRLIGRLGIPTVIIAALTPLPYSVVSMIAGSLRMRFAHYALASLFRIPRIAGYFLLIYLGWTAG